MARTAGQAEHDAAEQRGLSSRTSCSPRHLSPSVSCSRFFRLARRNALKQREARARRARVRSAQAHADLIVARSTLHPPKAANARVALPRAPPRIACPRPRLVEIVRAPVAADAAARHVVSRPVDVDAAAEHGRYLEPIPEEDHAVRQEEAARAQTEATEAVGTAQKVHMEKRKVQEEDSREVVPASETR